MTLSGMLLTFCAAASGMLLSQDASAAQRSPNAYVRSDGVDSIVYWASNNHIIEIAGRVGGGWSAGDLSSIANAPAAAGDPAGFVRADHVNAVVYRASSNHIIELALGSDWGAVDLTALTGAPAAAGNPMGYQRSDSVSSVIYRGTDKHIHELYLPYNATTWHTGDLTAQTGARAAGGDPFGYVRSDHVNSVVYEGTDNHIHEIYLPLGGSWRTGDLTKKTGAPDAAELANGTASPAGDPLGYVRSDNTNSVVYLSIGGDLIELSLKSGAGAWRYGDLTLLTGSSAAYVAPAGYRRSDSTNAVVSFDLSQDYYHVVEISLERGASKWVSNDLTTVAGAPVGYGIAPAAFVRAGGVNAVLYHSGSQSSWNDIVELELGTAGWVYTDLTKLTGAPAGSLNE